MAIIAKGGTTKGMLPRKIVLPLLCSLIAITTIGIGFWSVKPVYAGDPPIDYACRACHDDNQDELTLSSGETLSLQVPLDVLNSSAHNPNAQTPVSCLDCHRTRLHYQYPHQPPTAATRQDFRLAVSERCQECHFPHSPLHATDQPNPELPICVDCHGGHQLDRTDDILNNMPTACLACHTDQTTEWVADFITPRLGVGQAAPGYVGSDRCGGCHEQKYFSWRNTLHARMIQDPVAEPNVIVGDFNQNDPDRTFGLADVVYTIGSRWKQRYLTQDENGNFYILPAQWNVETGEWVAYNPDTWPEKEWRQSCGSCHVTGLDTETWGLAEFGIGCESCHGPGADHTADPQNVKPFTEVDDQVCGACHSRGTSPDGLAFPATYRPGDTLADHFTFTTDPNEVWPDGSAKKHRQQYMDWQLGSNMARSVDTNCTTCHAVHDNGIGQTQLVAPLNELCLQCHTDKKAIINHVPFHDKAAATYKFTCADCHMPKMATSARPYDIRSHAFTQPNPQASLDHGGVNLMLNACNTCHTDLGEDPQWAAETVAYVTSLATPSPEDIFGPGPTPTSPPPPTPLPSVGQPAPEHVYVETGRWLRITAFTILGIIVAASLYWGAARWFVPLKRGD
jgi:predicted CXXCH cytochrome family protein